MDELESKAMAETALRLLACVLTPATLTLALVLGPFLELWLGKQHGSAATPVGYLLLFGFWANSLAKIAISRLQALGRPRFPALAHTGEVVPYAVVLYAGLTWMGLMGAAIAWSARAVIDAIILGLGNRLIKDRPQPRLAVGADPSPALPYRFGCRASQRFAGRRSP